MKNSDAGDFFKAMYPKPRRKTLRDKIKELEDTIEEQNNTISDLREQVLYLENDDKTSAGELCLGCHMCAL